MQDVFLKQNRFQTHQALLEVPENFFSTQKVELCSEHQEKCISPERKLRNFDFLAVIRNALEGLKVFEDRMSRFGMINVREIQLKTMSNGEYKVILLIQFKKISQVLV